MNVRCVDKAGNAVDSEYTILILKPDSQATNFTYTNHDGRADSTYTVPDSLSHSPGEGINTVTRFDVGDYYLHYLGIADVGHWNHVTQVTTNDPLGKCNTASDFGTQASIRCFDLQGNPMDKAFQLVSYRPDLAYPPAQELQRLNFARTDHYRGRGCLC